MRVTRVTCVLPAIAWCTLCTGVALPATIERAVLGTGGQETACAVSHPVSAVEAGEKEIFLRFQARRVRTGDRLRVDWIDPRGETSSSAAYDSLPAANDLCFLTALPIGGFPPAAQPGDWWVRVTVNDQEALTRRFRITGVPNSSGVRIDAIQRTGGEGSAEAEIRVQGAGFVTDSVAHIAQYTPAGGWSYIAAALPVEVRSDLMVVRTPPLPPAEYLVIIQNPDGRQSLPARFLISTQTDYRLPMAGGARAEITQGPYGSFSHYGNSQHAYDITGPRGACIVAMRGGTVYAFDLKLGQTPTRRIFGNYITIRHDNGEFSHYGHLAAGTFLVHSGEHVEQGQPLARMGNSGYTLGEGGGYHVHVHVTRSFSISSPSIPFRFEELPLTPRQSFHGAVLSANLEDPAGCTGAAPAAEESSDASVALADWWNRTVTVARGARSLEVRLRWDAKLGTLNLNVVSPSGRQFGAYGEPTGYSGVDSDPESLVIADPEPGTWHIGVHGVGGNGEAIPFHLTAGSGSFTNTARAASP